MLTNNEIIEKLTTKQKIALLADSREVNEELGGEMQIPSLSTAELADNELDENGEFIFPSYASLANSWDTQLFGEISHKLACLKAQRGSNLFILPKVSAATSVYGKEITEDPYLAGALFSGSTEILSKAGVSMCMQAPTVTDEDIRALDKVADLSALFERVARPFKMVKDQSGCQAILTSHQSTNESYIAANDKMTRATIEKEIPLITKLETGDNTVAVINSGSQIIGGSDVAIEAAYDNYKRIYRSMEEGGATTHELEMALLDGAAISDNIIDEALDKKMSLAKKCSIGGLYTNNTELNHLAFESAKRSIVLVKNAKNVLPLQKGARVSVIGDIISNSEAGQFFGFYDKLSASLKSAGISVAGYQAGYKLDEDISEECLAPAIRLANASDTVLVFLGLGKQREEELDVTQRLMLPANQIALVSELAKTGKKIIAVICGSRLPNMSFDEQTGAVLLAPNGGSYVAKAVGEVLSGKFNPVGKLAYAGYDNADAIFKLVQQRKQKGEQKIGKMVGYRYTDIAKKTAKYPFGHGLSYSKFTYSRLQMISSRVISVDIQNTSNRAGTETVQVYVGCNSSSRIRPVKELKAISRVFLQPRQKRTVQITLNELGIYDTDTERFVVESGQYNVYVGSSVSDIRLTEKIAIQGATLKTHKRRMSEYLREESNIRSESYTMEAHCKPMKNVSKLKTFSFWLFALTVFSDFIYLVSGLLFSIPIGEQIGAFVALNAISISISLICFIVYLILRQKHINEQKKKEKIATKELFRGAEKINASSVEKLFVSEFDQIEEPELRKKTVTYKGKDESIYVYMAVETDFPTLCKDMERYFALNEVIITPAMSRAIVSSLMSSRLLVLRNKNKELSLRFAQILSGFFGTATVVDSLSNRNWEKDTLLHMQGAKSKYQTALGQAFYLAGAEENKACFYTMTDVKLGDTASFLMPYVQFLGSPLEKYTVTENDLTYTIPSNMWFLLIPDDDESLDSMPTFVTNLVSVIDVEVQEPVQETEENDIADDDALATADKEANEAENAVAEEAEELAPIKSVTPHQLEALTYRSKKASVIDEQTWKAVDTLEEFVNERTPYHIGNKIFLQLECYLSVYLACGGEIGEAVDGVLSSRLLPTILTMLKDNPQMADVDMVQTIESIFGEEHVSRSAKMINYKVTKPISEEEAEKEATEDEAAAETSEQKPVEPKATEQKTATPSNKDEEGDVKDAK